MDLFPFFEDVIKEDQYSRIMEIRKILPDLEDSFNKTTIDMRNDLLKIFKIVSLNVQKITEQPLETSEQEVAEFESFLALFNKRCRR